MKNRSCASRQHLNLVELFQSQLPTVALLPPPLPLMAAGTMWIDDFKTSTTCKYWIQSTENRSDFYVALIWVINVAEEIFSIFGTFVLLIDRTLQERIRQQNGETARGGITCKGHCRNQTRGSALRNVCIWGIPGMLTFYIGSLPACM